MAICCPSSIKADTIVMCRLDACGVPLPESTPMSRIYSKAYMSLTVSPDIEDGEVFEKKNGTGDYCIQSYDCPRLKKLDLTLNLCGIPTHVLEMLTGASLLLDGPDVVGGLLPNANYNTLVNPVEEEKSVRSCGNGVQMEFYSENNSFNDNCAPDGAKPFISWILPKTTNWIITSDLVFTNSILEVELEGIAYGAPNFEACSSASPWKNHEQEIRDTNSPLGWICTENCPLPQDCTYAD